MPAGHPVQVLSDLQHGAGREGRSRVAKNDSLEKMDERVNESIYALFNCCAQFKFFFPLYVLKFEGPNNYLDHQLSCYFEISL